MKRTIDSMFFPQGYAIREHAHLDGELRLSNRGQLELLRGMMERGVSLRTTVRGFSMCPFIRDEDVLTIAPMKGRVPRIGEVVAFVLHDTGRLAIHRVIAREATGWRVGGDNRQETDGVIALEDIVGRVVRVERRGREVRLGLGAERACIAALSRRGHLMRLMKMWLGLRRGAGIVRRRAQDLPRHIAYGKRRGS